MKQFNLTAWVLKRRAFTGFLLVLLLLGGVFACFMLEQREDPKFTFRVMVVKTFYPGATAKEVEEQLTDRLEKKIQELPNLDFLRSYSKPGESVIFVIPKENTDISEIPELYQVRKKVGDIQHTLPSSVIGPFFNDEFGDTYSMIYAFSGDGYSYAELKELADSARQQLLRIQDVEKVDLLGVQEEKVYVEYADKKLAQLGVDSLQLAAAIQSQNALSPAGVVVTPTQNLPVRVSGGLSSAKNLGQLGVRINGKTIRLADIADIQRGYIDPPESQMRFNGKPVIGVAVTMYKHGDVLQLGKALDAAMTDIERQLPLGVSIAKAADQARVVNTAIAEFGNTFVEALAAVLLVSFLSLGMRSGSVVALTVPIVLAATLLCMLLFGLEIHRISLGALILALGLLVDDAMIAVEMMSRKLEEGWDKIKAASYAYTTTAMPMLTGTLITVAGFLPVGLAKSSAGEYTLAIFQVVGISLLLSWLGAVVFAPYLGVLLLKHDGKTAKPEQFDSGFYRGLRRWVNYSLQHRNPVLLATALLFGLGSYTLTQVPQQFFPLSNRPELIIDLWLKEGSSFAETDQVAKRMEAVLANDADVAHYSTYIGGGGPRFFMLIVQQLNHSNLAEIVVLSKDNQARERLRQRIRTVLDTDFPQVRGRVARLDVGPPVEYPLVFRVTGENAETLRRIADQVTHIIRDNPYTLDVNDDWHERLPALHLSLDQDKARALGVTTQSLSQTLQAHYSGITLGQLRENDKLIDIVWRSKQLLRSATEQLSNISIRTASGKAVPLAQLATLKTDFEDGMISRRNRYPTISVRADVVDGMQAPDVAGQIETQLADLKSRLPNGYYIETGGSKEDAWTAQKSILIWIPLVIVVTLVLLMMQLQNLSRTLLVFMTAPLGVIGAAFALLLFHAPFGFVSLLGLIALAGMIMRNSVILVDQIDQDEKAGLDTWNPRCAASGRYF